MKVAMLFMHPFSESPGSVVRLKELAHHLGKNGVEVYILNPYESPNDLFPNVHVVPMGCLSNCDGLSKAFYQLSKIIYYNRAFPILSSSLNQQSKGIAHKIARGVSSFLLRKGIDLIQIEQDAPLPLGIALKKATGLPLVVDLHNISSEELVATGILKNTSSQFSNMQRSMKRNLNETDHIVVVSDEMGKYVSSNYGISLSNITIVKPGGKTNKEIFDSKFGRMKQSRPIKVVYAGSVVYREHVDLFVKSMPFVKHPSLLQFYITNRGEAVKKIKKLAAKTNVKPTFFWFDRYEEVPNFLSVCHAGILPSSNDSARRMGTPVKLFSYLSAGLPVVANDIGGWTEIIQREEVGLLAPDNPEGFGETISSLVNDTRRMQEYATNGLRLIRNEYNWHNSARTLMSAYDQILA